MQLPHLASRLCGTPPLLARAKLDILLAVLSDRIGWPEPRTAQVIPPPRTLPDAPPGIAVIPVYGTLVRRALGLEAASGLTSCGEIGALLDAALADPGVTGPCCRTGVCAGPCCSPAPTSCQSPLFQRRSIKRTTPAPCRSLKR